MQIQREKARVGMANGDEKFLPARDRGPQKRYVRDYVDARFSVGELLIPLMFAVIILTFFPQPEVQVIGIVSLWAFFGIAVVDVVVLGFLVTGKLTAKFGADRVERVRWYAAMRALQLRMMRLPKPQVKRGQFPS
jgi:prepilin signal peptidase PulO-like enzyme (type II secretory pathway)